MRSLVAVAVATALLGAGLSAIAVARVIRGSDRGEVIGGTRHADRIIARGGNDFVGANAGADLTKGGSGPDTIYGMRGEDTDKGGPDNDFISEFDPLPTGEIPRRPRMQVRGGRRDLPGDDLLLGGAGADRMEGSLGDDVLRAGAGDDGTLYGDPGGDTLYGNGGDDDMQGEEGADRMIGGDGSDHLDAVDDDDGEVDRVTCGAGDDTARIGPEDIVVDPANCETVVQKAP
jgi:Ca2+-binding RTX toxin-like protein